MSASFSSGFLIAINYGNQLIWYVPNLFIDPFKTLRRLGVPGKKTLAGKKNL